jgi:hypothetical protein
MRTVRPFWEFNIVWVSAGFSPHMLHDMTGFGLKLEKTSFLNSSLTSFYLAIQ